ncbi:uncharacterized protein [Battus philenor]|uniref:uncharacterized protein n=1 Tax=Battus philenor TaxID=42288 RepID=UPI0035CFC95B
MCDNSNLSLAFNLYEEEGNEDTTLDLSCQELEILPKLNYSLCVLYLQNNKIQTLSDDFFESLPYLMWLDLRDNRLNEIPKSIKNHQSLTHLLLQNNNLSSLPNELGTVMCLKVLQVSGNLLSYPPKDIINGGIKEIVTFLHKKFIEEMLQSSSASEDNSCGDSNVLLDSDLRSYNSILDGKLMVPKNFSVQLSERDANEADDECYSKIKGKCPKLASSRKNTFSTNSQSSKYVKPIITCGKDKRDEKIKQSFMNDMALKKKRDLLATREKILQNKKNIEALKNFRRNYRAKQMSMKNGNNTQMRNANDYPYDTSPEYMTFLTREDIEKDLPDKYKKRLWRRPKPTVPRKNNGDIHLALKIKQLFENLEAIDLNKGEMTPRTEQKILLNEIQKISEIKQKLMELSATNSKAVTGE